VGKSCVVRLGFAFPHSNSPCACACMEPSVCECTDGSYTYALNIMSHSLVSFTDLKASLFCVCREPWDKEKIQTMAYGCAFLLKLFSPNRASNLCLQVLKCVYVCETVLKFVRSGILYMMCAKQAAINFGIPECVYAIVCMYADVCDLCLLVFFLFVFICTTPTEYIYL
jgi:hypothetical protein